MCLLNQVSNLSTTNLHALFPLSPSTAFFFFFVCNHPKTKPSSRLTDWHAKQSTSPVRFPRTPPTQVCLSKRTHTRESESRREQWAVCRHNNNNTTTTTTMLQRPIGTHEMHLLQQQ
uniref:(northern house mosquito) hypothetical protein n=1 Tax=Culex pipiens TaxID=7175 RepID=A0A8D8FMH7_CULPI